MSLYHELKRRNVFRVAIAYLAMAWLLTEVADTLFPAFGIPDWGIRFIVIIFVLGFVPTLVVSWVYELTPDGIKLEKDVNRDASISRATARRLDVFTIGLILVAVIFILTDRMWLSPKFTQREAALSEVATDIVRAPEPDSQPRLNSIAVLPFVNMSSDAEQEYFSDGISEELLNLLAKLPGLRVIARTSSFAYKGKDVTIADIASELNVTYVLEGSVRKSGKQVRITAQLIHAADSFHVWSETYDRSLDNIFTVQDEIAAAVVQQLRVALLGEPTPMATKTNPEAYALFLQSQHVANRYTKTAFEEAEALLKEALAIDPGYAPAWRSLGGVYRLQEDFGRSAEESKELAESAFLEALSLDPDNAQVHSSLSMLARANFDFEASGRHLQRALQLNEDSAYPFGAAASLTRTFGQLDASIELARKSIAIDPVQPAAFSNLGYSFYYAHRLEEAASAFRKTISLSPERIRAHFYLGRVLLAQGELQDALVEMKKESGEIYRLAGLAMAYHALGDSDSSQKAMTGLLDNWSKQSAFQIAEVYAFRSENDMAFEWLQRAFDSQDAGLAVLLGDPVFATLTPDARYEALVNSLGLLPYWQEMKSDRPAP